MNMQNNTTKTPDTYADVLRQFFTFDSAGDWITDDPRGREYGYYGAIVNEDIDNVVVRFWGPSKASTPDFAIIFTDCRSLLNWAKHNLTPLAEPEEHPRFVLIVCNPEEYNIPANTVLPCIWDYHLNKPVMTIHEPYGQIIALETAQGNENEGFSGLADWLNGLSMEALESEGIECPPLRTYTFTGTSKHTTKFQESYRAVSKEAATAMFEEDVIRHQWRDYSYSVKVS